MSIKSSNTAISILSMQRTIPVTTGIRTTPIQSRINHFAIKDWFGDTCRDRRWVGQFREVVQKAEVRNIERAPMV